MPRYKSMTTLKKRNPSIFDILKQINLLYTRHKINKVPVQSGFVLFLGTEFQIGTVHHFFSLEIKNGKLRHEFKKKDGRKAYKPSSISTLRKLITEGQQT